MIISITILFSASYNKTNSVQKICNTLRFVYFLSINLNI